MALRSFTQHLKPHERIIVAWDRSEFTQPDSLLLSKLVPHIGMLKLGYESFTAIGEFDCSVAFNSAAEVDREIGIMVDLKFKDILNTVTKAVTNIATQWDNAQITTIHATMRLKTIVAALEAGKASKNLLVTGVTVLTDHDEEECRDVYNESVSNTFISCAKRLIRASQQADIRAGVVCSPQELGMLPHIPGNERLVRATPGVRPRGSSRNDQARVMTPGEAIELGADYLIIGRPVLEASDPVAAAQAIAEEIAVAL